MRRLERSIAEPSRTEHPRFANRRRSVAAANERRRSRRLGVLAALVAVPLLLVGALYSPLFAVRSIAVEGNRSVATEALLRSAGVALGEPLIDLDTAAVAGRVRAVPAIATVRVERRWPTRVRIVVTERTPRVGLRNADGSWTVADGTGRVLGVGSIRPATVVELRVTHDPGAGGAQPGDRLPSNLRAAAALAAGIDVAVMPRVDSVVIAPDGVRLWLRAEGKDAPAVVLFGPGEDTVAKQRALVAMLQAGALRRDSLRAAATPATNADANAATLGLVLDLRVPDTPTVRPATPSDRVVASGRGVGSTTAASAPSGLPLATDDLSGQSLPSTRDGRSIAAPSAVSSSAAASSPPPSRSPGR